MTPYQLFHIPLTKFEEYYSSLAIPNSDKYFNALDLNGLEDAWSGLERRVQKKSSLGIDAVLVEPDLFGMTCIKFCRQGVLWVKVGLTGRVVSKIATMSGLFNWPDRSKCLCEFLNSEKCQLKNFLN